MISRASKEMQKSGGENSVVFVRHERYVENEHQMPPGVYTEKVFYIRNFLPRFITFFVPKSKSTLVEKVFVAEPRSIIEKSRQDSMQSSDRNLFSNLDDLCLQSWNAYPNHCLTGTCYVL